MAVNQEDGQKSEAAPHHDAWKATLARWKPSIEDVTRLRDGLIASVKDYKKAKADQLAAEKRRKWEEAEAARLEAEAAAAAANAADIDAQREAAEKAEAAKQAEMAARQVKTTVKGTRKAVRYEITDHRDALHDIARNDKEAVTAFIEEYVRRNHKARPIAGVRVWEEKEAF